MTKTAALTAVRNRLLSHVINDNTTQAQRAAVYRTINMLNARLCAMR